MNKPALRVLHGSGIFSFLTAEFPLFPSPMPSDVLSGQPATMRAAIHPVVWLVGAWTTFFVLWTLFILGWGSGGFVSAVASASIATVPAIPLALFVWKVSGLKPWPEKLSAGFVSTHLGTAAIFVLVWTFLGTWALHAVEGIPFREIAWDPSVTSWRLLMGVWLYVIVSGISYAIRFRVRLRAEERRSLQAEALAAEARVSSLRNQLHPHFLYNALHTVSALIREDPDKAEHAMEQLGDLLRYAIRDEKQEFVTLAEEWAFTMDYVALQSLRMGNRMRVSNELDPRLASIRIPACTIQPLVENAINHGISGRAETGNLDIRAFSTHDNHVCIEVTDDGPGPGESTSGNAGRPSGTGQGLRVLRERLDLVFNGKARFDVLESPSGGTLARLCIPETT